MYTIGAFSKLSHLSARMLRYYDALGLLRPARVDPETGYRYYDSAQLVRLEAIRRLRDYGFSLAEVPELLELEQGELALRLRQRRLDAYRELAGLRAQVRRLEEELMQMEDIDMLKNTYQVILLPDPPRRMLTLRRTIAMSQIHDLFQDLRQEAAKRGLRQSGPTQSAYLGCEFNYEHMDMEAQMEVEGADPGIRTIPGGLYAATTHRGSYETLQYAYNAVCGWLGEHPEYRVCGPALERYLKDETSGAPPEEYETGILFPVEKQPESC